MPDYLRKRGSNFHFRRRIPKYLSYYFTKNLIQVPLRTDSHSIALQRAKSFNLLLEDFFTKLIYINQKEASLKLNELIQKARISSFQYISKEDLISKAPLHEFVNRVNLAHETQDQDTKKVLLGTAKQTKVTLSDARDEFFEHEKGNMSHLSANQLRKWENPRKKAVINFIEVVGNKAIDEIERKDILEFRKWWANRIKSDNMTVNSANKDFGNIRKILRTATDNHLLDINVDSLFKNVNFKKVAKTTRFPFSNDFIKQTFIQGDLQGLNKEAHLLILAMADTGARISELVGLDFSNGDIVLNDEIPHIKIRPNAIRGLKTPQSERDIPLVGTSLYAFKALETGFKHYLGKPDLISSTINKYFRENKLLPSENHSLYSLRHSFEDRLTAVEPPDKVQAELMGHKYSRPAYGLGPLLAQKKKWLDKIAFKI